MVPAVIGMAGEGKGESLILHEGEKNLKYIIMGEVVRHGVWTN